MQRKLLELEFQCKLKKMSAWQRCYFLALLQCCFLLLAVNGAPGVLLYIIVMTMIIVKFACACCLCVLDSPPDEALSVKGYDAPAGTMLAEDEEQEPSLDNMELADPLGSDDAIELSDDPEEPDSSKAIREEELNDDSAQKLDGTQPSAQHRGMTYIMLRMEQIIIYVSSVSTASRYVNRCGYICICSGRGVL